MNDHAKSVLECIDREATAMLLTDLVNISSPTGEEGNIARYLVDRFEGIGLKAFLQEADEDRYNAVGMLEGDGTGLSLGSLFRVRALNVRILNLTVQNSPRTGLSVGGSGSATRPSKA